MDPIGSHPAEALQRVLVSSLQAEEQEKQRILAQVPRPVN